MTSEDDSIIYLSISLPPVGMAYRTNFQKQIVLKKVLDQHQWNLMKVNDLPIVICRQDVNLINISQGCLMLKNIGDMVGHVQTYFHNNMNMANLLYTVRFIISSCNEISMK